VQSTVCHRLSFQALKRDAGLAGGAPADASTLDNLVQALTSAGEYVLASASTADVVIYNYRCGRSMSSEMTADKAAKNVPARGDGRQSP